MGKHWDIIWDIIDKSYWEVFVICEVGQAMVIAGIAGIALYILGNTQTMVLATTMGTRKGILEN